MPVGHSYRQHELDNEPFDAIVVGSGIGGLSVAAILAKHNKRVLVLEQHYVVGGFTHMFKRKDYEWDVGLHYVGDVHIEGTPINNIFNYISNGQLKWTAMPDVYDKAVFGNKTYEFVRGRENLKAQLKTYFPSNKTSKAIDAYFQLLDEVKELHSGYYIEKALPPIIAGLAAPLMRKSLLKYSDRSTLAVLQELTDNQKLIGLLTAQYGDYGLPPSKSSFYMHAMLANHYMEGAAYPVGGSGSIARHILPVIEASGGVVLSNAKVNSILVENDKAVGVKMEDGKTINAGIVISDTGVINTFSSLLPTEVAKKHSLLDELKGVTPAAAHVGLYVGFKQSAEELGLPKNNYWLFPDDYDHDKLQAGFSSVGDSLPVAYVSFPSSKDTDWGNRYPNKSTVEVITLVPYQWFEEWENTDWKKRGDTYEALKEKLAQQLLEELYRVQPQLRGKVDYYEVSTPLSTSRFMNHSKGEIYGLAHTPERFRQQFLKAYTPIDNLFLTGQDIVIASIGGGLMGGVLAASAILKKNMLNHIRNK
jgi:all-trans-retinol 13,14-reductase